MDGFMKRWLIGLVILAFLGMVAAVHIMERISPILIAYVVVLGVIGYLSIVIDKRRAVRSASRIPENVLLVIAAAGGWVGGSIAKLQYRHKTKKLSFQLKYFGAVLLNLALIYVVFWVF